MNIVNDLDTQPWYKQGWPWALIAIPFLTIVAGVIIFMIANDTTDSLVQDDYYKKGLAINSNIARVELAEKMSISAQMTFDSHAKLLTLKLTSKDPLPQQVQVVFSHPTLKEIDQSVVLSQLTQGEYVAELENLNTAFWHINIEDLEKSWLIKTRWLYPDIKELKFEHQSS